MPTFVHSYAGILLLFPFSGLGLLCGWTVQGQHGSWLRAAHTAFLPCRALRELVCQCTAMVHFSEPGGFRTACPFLGDNMLTDPLLWVISHLLLSFITSRLCQWLSKDWVQRMGLLVGLTSWDGQLGVVAHRQLAQVSVGRLCPECGVKCSSVLFWATTMWQLLAFSHKFMRVPSAGTCQDSSGDVVDVCPGPTSRCSSVLDCAEPLMNGGQQSQTFRYSHLWNYLYETLISPWTSTNFLLVCAKNAALCINTTCFPL